MKDSTIKMAKDVKCTSKKAKIFLQCVVTICALVPISAGLMGILYGPAMAIQTVEPSISLDSHFRYLSGLLLGIGLNFWMTVPHIEKKRASFQLLTLIVFIGGLGRLYALFINGVPESGMLFGLMMELVVTPLLALWQTKVADLEMSASK